MGLVDINLNATLHVPPELTAALAALLKKGDAIMNDVTVLKQKMDALEAKSTEANKTLTDLAKHFGVTRQTARCWRANGRLFIVTVVGRKGKSGVNKEFIAYLRPDEYVKYSSSKSSK